MSDDIRTTRTETQTHYTVTIMKPKTGDTMKKPSIRSIVKRHFALGSSMKELMDEVTLYHPDSAAVKSPKTHVGFYRNKMKGEWEMNGPWAPKHVEAEQATELVVEEISIEEQIIILEEKLAALQAARQSA